MKKTILLITAVFLVSIAQAQTITDALNTISTAFSAQQSAIAQQSATISLLQNQVSAKQKTTDSLIAVIKDLSTTTPPPVVTPPPVTTPPTAIVYVGDGKSQLTIDGKKTIYKPGTLIIVKAGTYYNTITLKNLTGVTVYGQGVILDGVNQTKTGNYNMLDCYSLSNVIIRGFTTQNVGYRMINLNDKMLNITLDSLVFNNNIEGLAVYGQPTWDGTDATVNIMNLAITNCVFKNCGGLQLGGNIGNGKVTGLVKNFVFSGNTITGGNPEDALFCGAIDGYNIFNNNVSNINLGLTNDNRVFQLIGNGDFHDNIVTNIQGHTIADWAVSFGTEIKTSHYYHNTCIGSMRYSSFEFQEFAGFAIPGKTTSSNLVVDGNTCGNLNTDHWTDFASAFIDNYMWGYMGGQVTLTNNIGYNFFPVPVITSGQLLLWNQAMPTVINNNTYSTTKQ